MAIKPPSDRTTGSRLWSVLAICAGLSLPLHALSQDRTGGIIEAYGDSFTQSQLAPRTQARVYAYRTDKSNSPLPINLYLNGRYHASLLKGGYSEFCLAPGKIQAQVAYNDAGQMHVGKFQTGTPLEAQAGKVLFLKVQESSGFGARIETTPEPLALSELRQTRQQIHTLSRAPEVKECNSDLAQPVPAAPAPKPAPQREYALQTDALFEFGKAVLRADGFNAIESMIQQVQQDYSSIDRIRVIGYTDPIGPVGLNKKLSTERANAVATRLQARGLRPKSGFEAEGRWSLELAKGGCKDTPTPENKICHAPNRRVVIVIFGARR